MLVDLLANATPLSLPLTLANSGDEVAMIAVGGGIAIAIVSIVIGGLSRVVQTRARESSRREIAAYIAEGSMTPAEGERLMSAGEKKMDREVLEEMEATRREIAQHIAKGKMSAEDGARIINAGGKLE